MIDLKKDKSKKIFAKADSILDKILSCPCIKLPNSQTLKSDGVETGVLLSDFAQQRRRKYADVPDIYFILLDSACLSWTLVLNQQAKTKEGGSWVLLKNRIAEAAKITQTRWCCLRVRAQLSESKQSASIKEETIFAFKTFLHKIYSCHR